MSDEVIHLFMRHTPEGIYATSPQFPGLLFGRKTPEEIRSDLPSVLEFHSGKPFTGRVAEHFEWHMDIADREVVVRIVNDGHSEERSTVAGRLEAAFSVPGQVNRLADEPTNAVGEIVFICADPSDTLGWVYEQIDPGGDAVIVALAVGEAVGDALVFTMPLIHREGDVPLWPTMAEIGHDVSTTLGKIMRSTPIVQPVMRQPLLAR